MRINDNSFYGKDEFLTSYPKLGTKLLDQTVSSLAKNDDLIVFPPTVSDMIDVEEDSKIFESHNKQVRVQNTVGFLGLGKERLEIRSRFSQGDNDYFLHYMLQKVLNVNLINLNVNLSSEEKIYRLLMYVFPSYLNAAMRKGLYKEYKRMSYNEENVKGPIDVARHIKSNVPFVGKVAYSTREFTQDNDLMQLVRHTIDHIESMNQSGYNLLNQNDETRGNKEKVIQATPLYKNGDRHKVIVSNQKKTVRHAYYHEYRALQKMCLMILTNDRHGLGKSKDEIHGILFDVSWLWEEYLNSLLKESFVHPDNKTKTKGISLFSDRQRTVYPDFYSKQTIAHKAGRVVADAKYKKLEDSEKGISREDLYQIISYGHVLNSSYTGVIYPSKIEKGYNVVGILKGQEMEVFKYGFEIPQNKESYTSFFNEMKEKEKRFVKELKKKI